MSDAAERRRAGIHETTGTTPLQRLLASAPVGIAEATPNGDLVWVNRRWREITGVDQPLPIPYERIARLIHPEDRTAIEDRFRRCREQLEELDAEARILRDDRAVRHIRLQVAPLVDSSELAGFVGALIDLTPLVEATEAKRRSEQRYRDLLARAPVGQAIYTSDGVLVEVNAAWLSLLGYEAREVIGRRSLEFVHPDDRDATLQTAEDLVAGRIATSVSERRLRRKDGSYVWVSSSITLERDAEGRPDYFHSMIIDITEAKNAEARLRDSEERYRRLIDEAPVAQVIARIDGTLVEVNRAFLTLLATTRDEVFSRSPVELFHPDDLLGLRDELNRLLAGEIDHFEMERRLVRADGAHVWVAGGTTLIRQGDQLFLHSVLQDITERKLAEQALRESEERYRAVIEALHDGVLVQGRHRLEAVNGAAVRLLGRSANDLARVETWDEMDPIDDRGEPIAWSQRSTIVAVRERRPVVDQVAGLLVPGRGRRWFSFNAVPRIADGEVVGAVTTFTDITDRKLAEDALRASELLFRTLASALPIGIFQTDGEDRLVYVNPRWSDITEIPEHDALGKRAAMQIHPDDLDHVVAAFRDSLRGQRTFRDQYRIITPSGALKWIRVHATQLFDAETGRMTARVGSIEDITPLISAANETNRLASIVESTSDLIGVADLRTGELTYLNRAARELFGYGDRDLDGTSYLDLYEPEVADLWSSTVIPTLQRGESWSGELPMRAADGSTVLVWQTLTAMRGSDGEIDHISAVGRDVTERRRWEAELAHQATHDTLTDLPNRVLLLDHLELALARAERDGRLVALLFLDLDRFKAVNDTLGHDAGDALLISVANRIREAIRPTDTVARLGGDEFVVLCEDVIDEHHAVSITQRILSVIESQPLVIDGVEVPITASVGIALSPGGHSAHPEALLRDADAAMYRAKDRGRARLELFDESMRRRAAQRIQLAEELTVALDHRQITVHYQPCIDLESGTVTSVEALARWQHPTRGLLPPGEFIALAEETGLIVGLGLEVLSVACAQGRRWQEQLGERAPRIHVNLSARQLGAANLPILVEEVLDASGLRPSSLCLEITESVLMDDAPASIDVLRQLKELGVVLAIDDFGTGYSSLSYLRRFPVDVLKVDRSFVDGLGPDAEDSAIVAAIVNLARTLALEPVAEGVETAEQVALLRELGCAGAQGFLFARPAPAEVVSELLTKRFPV
jgi:diguanylate cyclase (GGDEF)-like protein/PAS domain S-box-containing protein